MKRLLSLLLISVFLSGCSTTPAETTETDIITFTDTSAVTDTQTEPTTTEMITETEAVTLPALDYNDISTVVPRLEAATTSDVIFVTVQTTSSRCKFYAYVRSGGGWEEAFTANGYLGRTGVCPSDKKREGDGHTPAGVYSIGECFGIKDAPCEVKPGYTKLDNDDYWDSDPSSPTYNEHVKGSEKDAAWLASGKYEHLIRYSGSYDYAAMINYNVPAAPGRGSAIFLHCTSSGSTSSAGCVAVPSATMKKCLAVMSVNSVIVIVKSAEDLAAYTG